MASVIIPSLNAAHFLPRQLDAVLPQATALGAEVLVSDNGSVDGTADLIRDRAARGEPVRLVDASQRPGQSWASNVGAAAARSDALVFCDADDMAAPGWLAALLAALERHHFVAGSLDGRLLNPRWARLARPVDQSRDLQRGNHLPHAGGCNLAVRAAAFRAVGGFDPSLRNLADTDLCWRLQEAGYPLVFEPAAVMHYRVRQELRGIYRQAYAYGRAEAVLASRHALPPQQGPAQRTSARVATLTRLARHVACHPGRAGVGRVLWVAGWHAGHRFGEQSTPGSPSMHAAKQTAA